VEEAIGRMLRYYGGTAGSLLEMDDGTPAYLLLQVSVKDLIVVQSLIEIAEGGLERLAGASTASYWDVAITKIRWTDNITYGDVHLGDKIRICALLTLAPEPEGTLFGLYEQ